MKMEDQFGRRIDYMRISITDRCNLRCRFCMPEEPAPFFGRDELLREEELIRIVKAAAALGIKNVRLTGGEPLLYPEIGRLIAAIRSVPGMEHVFLTTNGILLEEKLQELCSAGLSGVNISLCSADPEEYRNITGVDGRAQVLRAIDAACGSGIRTKVNCVPMPGANTGHLTELLELAGKKKLSVRFIEMMPVGQGKYCEGMSNQTLFALLEKKYGKAVPEKEHLGSGPAVYYHFPNFCGSVGFISANSGSFCGSCNRIRLMADGFLKLCLDSEEGVDLRGLLRDGCTEDELRAQIKSAVRKKPAGHHFEEKTEAKKDCEKRKQCYMGQIGG